jgi:hypothetical protein
VAERLQEHKSQSRQRQHSIAAKPRHALYRGAEHCLIIAAASIAYLPWIQLIVALGADFALSQINSARLICDTAPR